ncbi:MAG: SH3 domain-containing protein [Clostridia bacterium]|nr:SH3 domain-containing protein [Clostridia bacterium]
MGYAVTRQDAQFVYLRDGPTAGSALIQSYPPGTWAMVAGKENNWCHVTMPDQREGYISSGMLEEVTVAQAHMGFVHNPGERSFLNLRAQPSLSSEVVDIYYNGTPCVLLSQSEGWYHVTVDGTDGYFRGEYLDVLLAPYSKSVGTVTAQSGSVNLRTGPGYAWPSLESLGRGSYVTILKAGDGWTMVAVRTAVGFLPSDAVTEGILKPDYTLSRGLQTSYVEVSNPKATQVLNLRAQPDRSSESIGQFSNGQILNLLEQGTEWCQVSSMDGRVGYMMTSFLTLHEASETPTKNVQHPDGEYVNLRSSPSLTESSVLLRMPSGASVTVISPGDEWFHVVYNGIEGYVMAAFLK